MRVLDRSSRLWLGAGTGTPLTDELKRLAMMLPMAAVQTADEIKAILVRMHGQTIDSMQVLGINSLKSIDPLPESLVGATITTSAVSQRVLCLIADAFEVEFDLQRTGKVIWFDAIQPYRLAAGVFRPTVRLMLCNGSGIDLTEPAKTKRITVTLSRRGV